MRSEAAGRIPALLRRIFPGITVSHTEMRCVRRCRRRRDAAAIEAPVARPTVRGFHAEVQLLYRGLGAPHRCALISGQEPVHLPPDEAGKARYPHSSARRRGKTTSNHFPQ